MKTRLAVLAVVALALASTGLAQDSRGAATATIGGEKVEIDYGQPQLKGRDLSELMKQLPPDRIWRAGVNQVSTLTTGADLMVGGKKVPAGKYSVYVHAGEAGGWSFILNEDLGVPLGKIWDGAPDNMKNEPWPHGNYADIADKEVARVELMKGPAGEPMDKLTMAFKEKEGKVGLLITWGDRAWMTGIAPAK